MSFSSMMEILQERNKGKIVLIKLGAFYVATEKDAVFLHEKLELKCTCFKNNEEDVNTKNLETKQLILIPKIEDYIEYIVNIIFKLPRTEKFSIGNEYKKSIYETLERALYIEKINKRDNKKEILTTLNQIDSKLNCQRIYLRIMKKQK